MKSTNTLPQKDGPAETLRSSDLLAGLDDADLNRQFARAFWNRPIDERNNTYWHDDDTTPEDENHEWKPLPDFCNDWRAVRKIFVDSRAVIAPDFIPRTPRERNRRVMIHLLRHPETVSCPHGMPKTHLCRDCRSSANASHQP